MIKLIATDMDGTLVDQKRELPQENAEAILEAQRKGIIIVVATGRDYTEAIKPLKDNGIRCPVICVNGAETRSVHGEVTDSVPLNDSQFNKIKEVLTDRDIYFEIYTSKGAYTNNQKAALQVIVDYIETTGFDISNQETLVIARKRFQNGEITYIKSYNDLVNQADIKILKVLAFTRDDKARQIAKHKLANETELAVSSSANDNIEITNRSAQKGIALKRLADQFGIAIEDIMAIGDNYNDLSMLELAGVSVAMANAEIAIKERCSFVTKTNDENGVAYAINKYTKEVAR